MDFFKKNYKIIIGVILVYLLVVSRVKIVFFTSIFAMIAVVLIVFRTDIIILIAILNYNKGNVKKGDEILNKLIEKNTKNCKPYIYVGNNLLHNGCYDEAISLFKKALTLNPDIISHKNIIGSISCCYWKKNEIDTAIEYIETLQKKYDYINDGILATLGYFYILNGEIDKALEITELALQDNENNSQCYDNKGQIFVIAGNHAMAYENFHKAIELKPTATDALYNLGCLYEKDNNTSEALKYFKLASEVSSSNLVEVTSDQINEKIKGLSK